MLFSEPEYLLSLYNAVTGKDYRDLFYIASEYQALADGKSLYSSGIQKIPTPKFLVFYNGLDRKVPDRMELRLSDAYENPVDEPDLELKVTMLNINAGHNEELMNSCHVLQEYARYVARVRKAEYEYGREQGREEGREEGRIEGERSGRTHLLTLISQMSAGEDADKVTQLTDPEVLEAMMKKYGIE